MTFRGLLNGAAVSGEIAGGELRRSEGPGLTDALLRAASERVPVYIAGIADELAAFDEGPAGYATVATVLDPGTARFDPPLEVPDIPDGAVA